MFKQLFCILLLMTLMFSYSCQKEPVSLTRPEALDILKKKPKTLTSSSNSDADLDNQIFLGFRMGMDNKQVRKHVTQLHKKGVMRRVPTGDDTFRYVYDIKLPSGDKTTLIFNDNYEDDVLYRISCTPQLTKDLKFDELWTQMGDLLTAMYGEKSISYKGPDCEGNLWLKGDVMIEQKCWDGEQKIEFSDAAHLLGVETLGL